MSNPAFDIISQLLGVLIINKLLALAVFWVMAQFDVLLSGGIPEKASSTSKFRPTIPFFVGPNLLVPGPEASLRPEC